MLVMYMRKSRFWYHLRSAQYARRWDSIIKVWSVGPYVTEAGSFNSGAVAPIGTDHSRLVDGEFR